MDGAPAHDTDASPSDGDGAGTNARPKDAASKLTAKALNVFIPDHVEDKRAARRRIGKIIALALSVIIALLAIFVLTRTFMQISLADLRGAIGFSSFGVLLYYFVANAAAYAQGRAARRFPRWLQLLGAAGCLVLVATLPWQSVVAGLVVFAVGIALRLARLALSR